jgi:hypothetical protein
MASNKMIRIGPVALTTTLTTNILNPQTLTGGVSAGGTSNTATYLILRHIRISNKTGSAATFSLWIGATGANAAGTEFIGTAQSVAANSYVDWYGMVRLDTNDFLVGGAGTTTALTLSGEGEIGIA